MRIALAAALLAAALPAYAQTPADLYAQGVAARHAGRNAEAAELMQSVVDADPHNADALVHLGYAQLALGSLSGAEQAFTAALRIAPSYDDARDGLAQVARRRAQRPAARLRVDLDFSLTDVGQDQPAWREAAVQAAYNASTSTSFTARLETSRRFSRSDTYGEVRVDHRLSGRTTGYLLLGHTRAADFRPTVQIGAGGAVRVRDGGTGTVLTLDVRTAEYPATRLATISPGIEQYFAGGRAWLTGRLINTLEEGEGYRLGWLLRADIESSDRLRLFAGVSNAPDVAQGVVIDSSSIFGGLSYVIGDRVTLRASLAREELSRGADRTTGSLGLGFAF